MKVLLNQIAAEKLANGWREKVLLDKERVVTIDRRVLNHIDIASQRPQHSVECQLEWKRERASVGFSLRNPVCATHLFGVWNNHIVFHSNH